MKATLMFVVGTHVVPNANWVAGQIIEITTVSKTNTRERRQWITVQLYSFYMYSLLHFTLGIWSFHCVSKYYYNNCVYSVVY